MKRFKSKKVRKKKYYLIIIFLFFFVFAYVFVFNYVSKNRSKESILDKDINLITFNLFKVAGNKTKEIINKPVSLLNSNVKNATIKVSKVNLPLETVNEKKEPIVYLYNTHQSEEYADYSVYNATIGLATRLNNIGVPTVFEEQSVTVFLQNNNLKYYKSYEVSRTYLESARSKYASLNYFFDIHRDSVNKNLSTITIDNNNYAKILFIVGLENTNYIENLNNTEKLNNIITKLMPGISRGILKKEGEGVNGVYNQDVSANTFLIEVGGVQNTKDEVERTMEVIERAIDEYVRGIV